MGQGGPVLIGGGEGEERGRRGGGEGEGVETVYLIGRSDTHK